MAKHASDAARAFIDLRRVLVRGGRGGLGCVSWHREPFTRSKFADGADGGRGGDVIFVSDDTFSSLGHVKATYVGNKGVNGMGKTRVGARGPDLHVKVPVGTVIFDEDKEMLIDLDEPAKKFVAAEGGQGGRGNTGGLKSTRATDPSDDIVQGHPGQERRLTLELKTLADVGLVGLPNAGKSTFLRAVSNAHPKVASYPFTTLNPHLGLVEFSDHWRMTVADIPGIVPGASSNRGLGHAFLRHIERNHVLLFIIDMSLENGSPHPCDALKTLQSELVAYRADLGHRETVIAANKMDRPASITTLKELQSHTNFKVIPLAAHDGTGVTDVTSHLRGAVQRHRDEQESRRRKASGRSDIQSFEDQLFSG